MPEVQAMKCDYGKCDVDNGDDYCLECLAELRANEIRWAKARATRPPCAIETPAGQAEIQEALNRMFKASVRF